MKHLKILIDNKIPFIKGALEEVAEVIYLDYSEFNSTNVRHADALIIRTRIICNEELLKGSKVKFIATATIGFDHIDTVYCKKNGISWTNAAGCNSSSVEQYFVSAILELSGRKDFNPGSMAVGVVGVGHVGSKVARAAHSLGMKVLENDPPRESVEGSMNFVSLKKIKQESDIITFHVPLYNEGMNKTYKMVNSDFFNTLNKPVYLINSSRGNVVDETALLTALKEGKIKGCILDVWENEPDINSDLVKLTEFATPHIAGYSCDGKANGSAMSVQAVSRFFGLGIDYWLPENLPLPEKTLLNIDCNRLSEIDIMRKVYSSTYSILQDDELLRNNLSGFEALRGSYRIRREPKAYTIFLQNNKYIKLKRTLENFGFNVIT